jgi:hypothetical protein
LILPRRTRTGEIHIQASRRRNVFADVIAVLSGGGLLTMPVYLRVHVPSNKQRFACSYSFDGMVWACLGDATMGEGCRSFGFGLLNDLKQ